MKKTNWILSVFLLALVLFCGKPAKAASYTQCTDKVTYSKYVVENADGKLKVTNRKTKKTKVILKSDYYITCITNGKMIYYTKISGGNTKVYRVKIDGTGKKKLFSLPSGSSLEACIGSKLFYTAPDKYDPIECHLYSCSLTGKNKKKVAAGIGNTLPSGSYLIGWPNSGAYWPMQVYSINGKTGKKTKIGNETLCWSKVGSKIYYLDFSSGSFGENNTFVVRSVNPSGSGKKKVGKTLSVSGYCTFEKVTSKYVYYYTWNSSYSTKINWRINIRTGKKEKV